MNLLFFLNQIFNFKIKSAAQIRKIRQNGNERIGVYRHRRRERELRGRRKANRENIFGEINHHFNEIR